MIYMNLVYFLYLCLVLLLYLDLLVLIIIIISVQVNMENINTLLTNYNSIHLSECYIADSITKTVLILSFSNFKTSKLTIVFAGSIRNSNPILKLGKMSMSTITY